MAEPDPWTSPAPSNQSSNQPPGWESKLIRELATAALKEQRRSRRWGIFFKLLTFAYLTFIIVAAFSANFEASDTGSGDTHTAVIDIYGLIASSEDANADYIVSGIQAAFEDERTAGVILAIDSPGGSPVQAGIIYDEIQRLRAIHADTPVYAVLGDICASGGYYIAAAADKIYADKASIVGSIGVRMDNFGFTGLMEKIGVERRLLTSGESKALLDPFLPENPSEKAHVQTLLDDIHAQFIAAVKEGRGDRLVDDPDLFSGLIWTGQQALEKGLVDELANAAYVAREVIGAESRVSFNPEEKFVDQLSEQLGISLARTLRALFPGYFNSTAGLR
ncbi:MAG: S49 family peptidase [Pseudomonadota bacterium]